MKRNKIRIGTRGSKLAVWQAEWVKTKLKRFYPDLDIELIKIKTTGDKILDVPLAKVGGKGLFVKEIEESLLRNRVDIAVHSMKDVPTDFPDGLHLPVICKREDPRDALIISQRLKIKSIELKPQFPASLIFSLPENARIGTSSLRRSCQLLHIRPDFRIEHLRGNLDTRLRKLDEGQYDAIILAAAGVVRLGLKQRISEVLPFEISLPAIGQGAIGIECRIEDEFINNVILPLNHQESSACIMAERAFLKKLEGGCQVPIAAFARIITPLNDNYTAVKNERVESRLIVMDGFVGSITGDTIIRESINGVVENAEKLGIQLAENIILHGAKKILDEIYGR
ncbi:MAG: hydroxymethylbilane synthase [Nitrospirae bacterium]|nr:hydroxymethylbilane synthase [Nitrospirota bacterium]